MNVTASQARVRSEQQPRRIRIRDWFAETLRTGRVPALLVAVAAGIIVYGFLFTADYAVRDIKVTGASIGDPEEIAAATGAFGVSVFRLNPDEIARNIGALPYVSSNNVVLQVSGKIEISIVEKQPVLAWRSGADLFLVDKYGDTIGNTTSSPLSTVYLESVQSEEFKVTAEQVATVLAVKDAFGDGIAQLEWRIIEGLTVMLDSDQTVVFGDHRRLPQKIAVFSAVVDHIDPGWRTLDLREPDTPYFN